MLAMILAWLRRWFMPDDSTPVAPAAPPLTIPDVLIPAPGTKGVAYVPPPASILPAIMKQVEDATAPLKAGEIALVGVADRKGGWNAAVVAKLPHGVSIDTWIGKSWAEGSELDYGVRMLGRWTIGGSR